MSFYHAIHAARSIQMSAEKKKRSCLFSSATARPKKGEKLFSSDWAKKLAESDKGSYFDQEQWLKELNEQSSAECIPSISSSISLLTCSASRSKITVEEPLADLEVELVPNGNEREFEINLRHSSCKFPRRKILLFK